MSSSFTEQIPIILWSPLREHAEQDCACAENGLVPLTLFTRTEEHAETDCACADTGLAPVLPTHMETAEAWQTAVGLYQAPLPDAHELVFNPLGPAGVVVLNKPARAILNAFAHPRPLDGVTSRQLASLGLLQPHGTTTMPIRSQPRTLIAWLHVTNACNLDCAYCYVEKNNEAMDEATGRAAVDAVFRSATHNGFQAVKLKYSGGEPTLNFGLVHTLHSYASEVAKRKDLELREVLLSNGVALTDPMLDFIAETGMRLMISLDGVGASHDAQRAFADGQGTFDRVAEGIDRALPRGIAPYLSITVTGRNLKGLADVVAFALERDLLFNLNFYRSNGHAAWPDDLIPREADLIAAMRAAFAVIEDRLPRRSLIAGLVDRASFGHPHDRACGAGHSYVVIDQRGRVARCQMEMDHPVTDVWAKDPLATIRSDSVGFQNVAVDKRVGCDACSWRYWCGGGCPLLTYCVNSRNDVKSPYCNVYRTLYPDLLRLEGLRLLRWKVPLPM